MARQKKTKFVNVLTWLLLLLLLVGAIGAICHFAGIGKDDIKDMVSPTFRIEYNGKVFKTDTVENAINLPESGQARFEVKGTNSYSVAILPNVTAETDFDYTVNGKTYPYSGEKDLSYGFDLKCYENAFVINADDCSLESVLSKIWESDTVEVSEPVNFSPYKIVITSSNGEVIELQFPYVECTGVELPENLIF